MMNVSPTTSQLCVSENDKGDRLPYRSFDYVLDVHVEVTRSGFFLFLYLF